MRITVNAMLGKGERKKFEEAAREYHMTLSEFMRMALLYVHTNRPVLILEPVAFDFANEKYIQTQAKVTQEEKAKFNELTVIYSTTMTDLIRLSLRHIETHRPALLVSPQGKGLVPRVVAVEPDKYAHEKVLT